VTCTSGTAEACGQALREALAGDRSTLYVCPGTYQGGFEIARDVSVIGAGQGNDPASNTVLTGGATQRVLIIPAGQVALRQLHVRDGNVDQDVGGGIANAGTSLSLHDCTVTECTSPFGGGIYHLSGTLDMTGCTVSANTAPDGGLTSGGGLVIASDATLTDC
jgi:hypothetical protein